MSNSKKMHAIGNLLEFAGGQFKFAPLGRYFLSGIQLGDLLSTDTLREPILYHVNRLSLDSFAAL